MKIRLMGSPDVVRQWAAELEKKLGVTGKEYPMRGNQGIRWYADVDDRTAQEEAEKLNNEQ